MLRSVLSRFLIPFHRTVEIMTFLYIDNQSVQVAVPFSDSPLAIIVIWSQLNRIANNSFFASLSDLRKVGHY